MPVVLEEKPSDESEYGCYSIDGFDIYVHNSVKTVQAESFGLNLSGFFKLKEIKTKGIKIETEQG